MESYYPQGIAQMIQTAIAMGFGLLFVATMARRAYTRRGWLVRLTVMLVAFVLLGRVDVWSNEGVGKGSYGEGIGTSIHYIVLGIVILITLGTFIATLRAHRKTQMPYPAS